MCVYTYTHIASAQADQIDPKARVVKGSLQSPEVEAVKDRPGNPNSDHNRICALLFAMVVSVITIMAIVIVNAICI